MNQISSCRSFLEVGSTTNQCKTELLIIVAPIRVTMLREIRIPKASMIALYQSAQKRNRYSIILAIMDNVGIEHEQLS